MKDLTKAKVGRKVNMEDVRRSVVIFHLLFRHRLPSTHPALADPALQVQEAAGLLLESKMFYVPFLLNSTINSRPEQEAAALPRS